METVTVEELKPIKFTTEVMISIQAQKVLSKSGVSIEDFQDWIRKNPPGIGGSDVTLFLEELYNEEHNGSTG